jgi:DNA-binding MarR family transcriptional regulator
MTDDRTPALDLVYELVVLLGEDMTRSLARDGLTVSRAHVMWELQQRGPSTQRALADALGVSPRHVTGLVDALEGGGLVVRRPHPADRRAVLVELTEPGSRAAEAMDRGKHDLARVLFGDMAPDRYRCLLAGLGEVLTALRERGLSAPEAAEAPGAQVGAEVGAEVGA